MSLSKLSMKAKLILVAFVISIVAQSAFQIMSMRARETFKEGRKALTETVVTNYLDKIDRNLFERYGDVQAFALSEPARSGNPDRILAFMNDMMTTYAPIYDLMVVTNTKGRVIAVNSVDKAGKPLPTSHLLGRDYSGEEWFKASVSGKVEPGQTYVQDLVFDNDVAQTIGNQGRVMKFTAPIRDKNTGEILGVWNNRMSWDDVVGQITKENASALKSFGVNTVLSFLMNSEGTYLLHPDGDEVALKDKWKGLDEVRDIALKGIYTDIYEEKSKNFQGEVLRAVVSSKGYSLYPGKGWFAKIEIPMEDPASAMNNTIFAIATCILILCLIYEFWSVGGLAKKFQARISELTEQAEHLKKASLSINSGSQSMASAATEQASALQETASSIEEMSAMVKKSADNANNSRESSERSHSVAAKGKETVEEMMLAIEEINVSNDKIMRQIEESNQQISEIVKVITEIGNKTKVINDIVFQTKLLSFNASVEAARAGEHGKGFAVVAEEVGNLAQMSGNAAKEIADMLNASIQRVESIVDNTKQRVERLIAEGREKVQAGTVVAKQCGTILEEVVQNVGDVNRMIGEISTAAREQSQGISEITRAMNQLDQVTHQNATTSNQQAEAAEALLKQSDSLMSVVSALEGIVKGGVDISPAQPKDWAPPASVNMKMSSQPHLESRPKSSQPPVKLMPFGSEASHHEPKMAKASQGLKVVGGDTLPTEDDPRFRDL